MEPRRHQGRRHAGHDVFQQARPHRRAIQLFETGLLGDEGLACLECPAKANVAENLLSNLEIVRDLAGGASRVVVIELAAGFAGVPGFRNLES